jgi:hypothetical protein
MELEKASAFWVFVLVYHLTEENTGVLALKEPDFTSSNIINMGNLIKLILAILLFLCLLDMPYGFFQFVRFLALIGFAILAFEAKERGQQNEMIVYIALAILFQPLLKISLGRSLWNIVDVVVGIGLIVSVFSAKQKANHN